MTPLDRLHGLGLVLPTALESVGKYAATHQHGLTLWVAGHTARTVSKPALAGVVGDDLDVGEAAAQAALAALNLLSTADSAVGLDNIAGVIHLRGFVRSGKDFAEHPRVIDGASELLTAVFADSARHARTAVGVISLPGRAAVELEAVFALHGQTTH